MRADVRYDDDALVLASDPTEEGVYHLPRTGETIDGSRRRALTLAEALHVPIRPVGTAEEVLRDWAVRGPSSGPVRWKDPTTSVPKRVRAGAIVIRDGQILLIRQSDRRYTWYEIPGGGVEAGETLHEAVVRELREETALGGSVAGEVARVWKEGTRQHYFLVHAEGEVGAEDQLDNYGGRPVWKPVADLPGTALWPRRLSWRIAHWHDTGWPAAPIELADSVKDLGKPCTW
ncbi:NUDIX domain-containing protein [Streptomyces sp. NPDC060184]|uniref:NUDIX domain-containing protein n=1 Tax=Streptomyces sp. NPDC060184 TaxID=3347064 RepID=UPI00365441F5